jgi:hypothetical protein
MQQGGMYRQDELERKDGYSAYIAKELVAYSSRYDTIIVTLYHHNDYSLAL